MGRAGGTRSTIAANSADCIQFIQTQPIALSRLNRCTGSERRTIAFLLCAGGARGRMARPESAVELPRRIKIARPCQGLDRAPRTGLCLAWLLQTLANYRSRCPIPGDGSVPNVDPDDRDPPVATVDLR